ncbi:MAG: hypothetical protein UHN59_08440 [Bacteroidales bacterium]|nr:hypothetical protein [Bacteroidales bacterium]
MNSRARTPFIISVSVILGVIIGYFLIPSDGSGNSVFKGGKMEYVLSLIDAQYVDKVDIDSLEDVAIRSFLADLDPHSVYMTAEEIKKETIS